MIATAAVGGLPSPGRAFRDTSFSVGEGRCITVVAVPSPATSNSTSTEPTGAMLPTSPCIAVTVPSTGEVISTVALSVITSTRWLVFLDVIARLYMPGHDLGLGDAFADIGQAEEILAHPLILHRLFERLRDTRRSGEIIPLESVRIGRVPARHALDRRS